MVIRRGIVGQLTSFSETGAVAGAIPGVLGFVVFESATKVGAVGVRSPTVDSKAFMASCE